MQRNCIWGHSFCDNTQDPKNAKLESHISAAGSLDKKPEDAFAVDPEPRPNTDLGQVAEGTVMGGQHTHENVHSGRS